VFAGRRLLIATKHQKEEIFAPLLEKALGVSCFTDPEFDSDSFGTFTGEVERPGDAEQTARLKAKAALHLTAASLVLASEGSFGPHPQYPFLPADEEILLLYDAENQVDFLVRETSLETNFSFADVLYEEDLLAFAKDALFPDHALILRGSSGNLEDLVKGISDEATLRKVFKQIRKKGELVRVETDMRAMFNPTRRKVLAMAAEQLCSRLCALCPRCGFPDFSVTRILPGLPCSRCLLPTHGALAYGYYCKACGFEKEEFYPLGKCHEDPGACTICNP